MHYFPFIHVIIACLLHVHHVLLYLYHAHCFFFFMIVLGAAARNRNDILATGIITTTGLPSYQQRQSLSTAHGRQKIPRLLPYDNSAEASSKCDM